MKRTNYKNFVIILSIIFFLNYQIKAITLVYSMRIRRSFVLGIGILDGKKRKSIWVTTAVPIVYKRDRHIIDKELETNIFDKRLVLGSIFNFRYILSKSWWFEATTSLQNESLKTCGTSIFKISRTGFDDVVLAGGYNTQISSNTQFILYGITGFPTRRKVILEEAQDTLIGTRFFSLGAGCEFSYNFINTLKKSFILVFQNRILHFFDRRFFPILPPDAKIQPGDVIDLLFTMQYRQKRNIFEMGYNPTFFTNLAVLLNIGKVKSENFVRHSVYTSYAHIWRKFPIIKKPVVLGVGLSIGRSKKFDTKIFSSWFSASIIF